jgi:predicted GNAT family N-acyltransferase
MSQLKVIPVSGPGDMAAALAIREVVFIEEQAVPADFEHDELDEKAFHVLAMADGHAVGTGRLIDRQEAPSGVEGRWGRVGRMAVLAAYRNSGVGGEILTRLEQEARALGLAGIVLHAQLHARGFYEKVGYTAFGPTFDEVGVAHIAMMKKFS